MPDPMTTPQNQPPTPSDGSAERVREATDTSTNAPSMVAQIEFTNDVLMCGSDGHVRISRELLLTEATWWRFAGKTMEEHGGRLWHYVISGLNSPYAVRFAMVMRMREHCLLIKMGSLSNTEQRAIAAYLLAEEAEDEAEFCASRSGRET